MTLETVLRTVVDLLNTAGIDHMLSGSVATAYYAEPRATQDIDVVVEVEREQIDSLVAGLRKAGFYVDEEAAHGALRSAGQFNAIDPGSGWKADLIMRKPRPFSIEEFRRRQPARLLGIDTWVATHEDLILAKLEWSSMGDSELQRRDVRALVRAAGESLDREYVERWAEDLGVADEWVRILAELAS